MINQILVPKSITLGGGSLQEITKLLKSLGKNNPSCGNTFLGNFLGKLRLRVENQREQKTATAAGLGQSPICCRHPYIHQAEGARRGNLGRPNCASLWAAEEPVRWGSDFYARRLPAGSAHSCWITTTVRLGEHWSADRGWYVGVSTISKVSTHELRKIICWSKWFPTTFQNFSAKLF